MSTIDSYKCQLLGFIKCHSDYDLVHNNSTRKIAVYKLAQNIPNEEQDFDGQTNDILVGGGSGEAPAFRISYPNAFKFVSDIKFDDYLEYDEIFKSFWTPTESFKLCNGFLKSGWSPEENIEFWLIKQICSLLIKEKPEYSNFALPEFEITLEFVKLKNETG